MYNILFLQAAQLVEPLQDGRSAKEFFTVYSRGGGLFESGFIESMIQLAEMDDITFAEEVTQLSTAEKSFVAVVKIMMCVPNICDVASITSVLLWILQCMFTTNIMLVKF